MKLRAPLALFAAVMTATLFLPLPSAAQVYRWVDSQGVIHYSDKPYKGARPGQVRELKLAPPPPRPENAPSISSPNGEPPEAPPTQPIPAAENGGDEEPEE